MSFDLVFFGGTGDLTWRKLMPSLFQAWRHGKLPRDGRILAVARDDSDDARYRQWLQERLQEAESAKRPTADEFTQFSAQIHYLRMDLSVPADYDKLKAWLNQRQADTTVMYLATSPHLFPVICQQLGACGLNHDKVRVVLEKPWAMTWPVRKTSTVPSAPCFQNAKRCASTITWASPPFKT